jgi:DNA polymerase (family 10)
MVVKATGATGDAAARLATIIGHGAQGAALARALVREGVRTRRGLRRPAVLARLPRAAQSSVLFSPARSTPLAAAQAVAAEIVRRLEFALPGGRARRFPVTPVGSIRRESARVRDLDFLIVVPDTLVGDTLAAMRLRPPRAGDRLSFADTYAAGTRRRGVIIAATAPGHRARHYKSDFFVTTAACLPFALFHYTGSGTYTIRIRAYAKRLGYRLNQYGLFDSKTGRRVRGSNRITTERELADFLNVTYRPPPGRDEHVWVAARLR